MRTDGQGRDPAKARFFAIQALRFTGVALVIVGILIVRGKIGLPMEAGYAMVLVGLADALVMPTVLARRWKSPLP